MDLAAEPSDGTSLSPRCPCLFRALTWGRHTLKVNMLGYLIVQKALNQAWFACSFILRYPNKTLVNFPSIRKPIDTECEDKSPFHNALYCWCCSQHQLSSCISLCALFAEPVVGKAWARRLEEEPRDCRRVYSLLAGTAGVAADITQH